MSIAPSTFDECPLCSGKLSELVGAVNEVWSRAGRLYAEFVRVEMAALASQIVCDAHLDGLNEEETFTLVIWLAEIREEGRDRLRTDR